jgi:phospholipid/cholesterol/gamma-HCH transport system substrate-binding protein
VQTPALRDLRSAAPDLTELLRRLGPFARSARPAVRGLGKASLTGTSAAKEARSTVRQLRALGTASTEPMRNLRFVLEDINSRDRAVEPNRLSPTGAGFTGLEALLQYFFVQSQAINIYDSKGFLLKLSVLLNECSQYTNAQTAIDNPERTKRCNSWLGPNQPGITTGAVSRTTPTKPGSPPRKQPGASAQTPAAPPAGGQSPAQPATPPPPAPPSLLPGAKDLLHKLLPKLPDVPNLLPRGTARSSARSSANERNLLDYLLGP